MFFLCVSDALFAVLVFAFSFKALQLVSARSARTIFKKGEDEFVDMRTGERKTFDNILTDEPSSTLEI